jgi:hypothetical protein
MEHRLFKGLYKAGAISAMILGSMAAHAGLLKVDFSTAAIKVSDPLAGALARAAIITGNPAIAGGMIFDSATPDTNATGNVGLYNGTLDSMQFSVGSWFSQTLTNIGLNGDITVRNNTGTGNNVVDQLVIQLSQVGLATAGKLDYAFVDPGLTSSINDDTRWVLDLVTITLTQNPPGATLPTLLDDDALPTTRSIWESPAWTARSIALRFNPDGFDNTFNENVTANLTSLHVPEPGSLALASGALLGLLGIRRRAR